MNITGNTLLITGGGTGIGRALAEALHARGNSIIITGRREDGAEGDGRRQIPAWPGRSLDIAGRRRRAPPSGPRMVKDHPALNAVILNAGIMKAEDMKAQPFDLTDSGSDHRHQSAGADPPDGRPAAASDGATGGRR